MDSLTQFRTVDELVQVLNRERVLFREMFERRKSLAYREEFALEIVDYKRERIAFLIDHGVIHANGDFLELEDVYVQFFEEVLDMNEEINIGNVKEYIDSLKENINYFMAETNDHRRAQYHGNVRKILRRIGLRTLKNVVDLKRNVESAYKQEPNYKIKKIRLVNLDEKRANIITLIRECERLMDQEVSFFKIAGGPEMQRTCMDVRNDFTEACHNLLEIEHQIIAYINRIDQQSLLFKKIRRLKYCKDQLTWADDTNVRAVVGERNPVWMEPRPYNRTFLSIVRLREDESLYALVRKLKTVHVVRRAGRTEASPISADYLSEAVEQVEAVNVAELWNAFRAQSADLFTFIRNFDYANPRTLADHIILFCQMATDHAEEIHFADEYREFQHIEYVVAHAK